MKIAINRDLRSQLSQNVEPQLISLLTASRMDVVRLTGFDGPTATALLDAMTDDDIVISLGGDGTFLRTAAMIAHRQIPILGINCGRLGFMADTTTDELQNVINKLATRQYNIERRTVVCVKPSAEHTLPQQFALNEIAVLKQDLSAMIGIDVKIGKEHLNTYYADGLIVATPTGSTAYNLSVGGPLLHPEVHSLVVSPVASHSLTARPIVIPDDCEISISVGSRSNSFMLSVDGQSTILPCSTTLTIHKAHYCQPVVRFAEHSFFSTLNQKLLWGEDKR
ncbi:MAG: NAD(+)/NADH kinase [Paludibacteraceae bacterium]|nr:NAD(+)/NADH kinase [Paludibacteraceae bacterium]